MYKVDSCAPVCNGDGVEHTEHEEERASENNAGEQEVARPAVATHLPEQVCAGVATNASCHGIQHNLCCVKEPTIVGVKYTCTQSLLLRI